MEKIFSKLFGETKWEQKKKLKKLFIWTAIFTILALLLLIDGPAGAAVMVVIAILMWGWVFVRAATRAAANILEIFGSDIAILLISLVLLIFLGIFGGLISLVLGIIRFIQLKKG